MKKTKIFLASVVILLASYTHAQSSSVGAYIEGDFNGDGQKEYAFAVKTSIGQGNPMDEGTEDRYTVYFSLDELVSISIGCCDITLINEGDLTGNGQDELSVYQAPMNGNTFSMTTYSFVDGSWKVVIDMFMIPTAGDFLTNDQLQKRIFKENGVVYFFDVDANDENFRLVKTKVVLK